MGLVWRCKECGAVLGWQDGTGLVVHKEAIQRYTLPTRSEEIWVTCQCGHIQIWRARVELASQGRYLAGSEEER